MYNHLQFKTSNELIAQYGPLVTRIARHLMARLPSHLLLDDLVQAGMVGLLEAARKFDITKGASFETYAGIRIRGAIIDEVRRGDWTPRSVHRNARRVSEAIQAVEGRTGQDASDHEVAQELGMSVGEYHQMLKDSSESRLFSLDELGASEDGSAAMQFADADPGPELRQQQSAFQQALVAAIAGLPERERLVLSLYYNEEMNLKEIGSVLGVSESRVSQIHTQAALRLRGRLREWQ